MSKKRRKPELAILVITHRTDGRRWSKRIKNSAKTVDILHQHFARDPGLFVYRVNCYRRPAP